jgi:hypothetical protein
MGEVSLMGKDVNFVLRMEKLGGPLGISVLTHRTLAVSPTDISGTQFCLPPSLFLAGT